MGKLVLLSFADSKYRPTGERLKKEAESFNMFTQINVLSEKDFDKWYLSKYKFRLMLKGLGFWMWKSYIVQKYYQTLEADDILLYIDAGCVINNNGKTVFSKYIDELKENKSGFLVFQQDKIEKYWTKADVFDYLDANNPSITNTGQIYAGCFFVKKNPIADEIIMKWYDICHNHYRLLSDNPSVVKNPKGFIAHRYDQSIFSVLVKTVNPVIHLATETYVSDDNWESLNDYPIHVKRLKTMDKKLKLIHRIKLPLRRVLNYLVVKNIIKFK